MDKAGPLTNPFFLIGIEGLRIIIQSSLQAIAQKSAHWIYIFPNIAYKRPIWHSYDLN